MARMRPPPKPAATRARTNRVTTAGLLHAAVPEDVIVPPLPDRPQDWHHPLLNQPPQDWHPLTRAWWADLGASPMAAENDATDVQSMLQLAVLVDDFWHAETPRDRQAASAEIRLQGLRFGLSPIVRQLIAARFGVTLTVASVGRTLHDLGFSAQRPLYRAEQADPVAVARWKEIEYPTIAAAA